MRGAGERSRVARYAPVSMVGAVTWMRSRFGPRSMRGRAVMDMNAIMASMPPRKIPGVLAAAALSWIVGIGPGSATAEECNPHCDRVQPVPYGDPRCGPRDIARPSSTTPSPRSETKTSRCDTRERPRQAGQRSKPTPPQNSPLPSPSPGQALAAGANAPATPATGASDPGAQIPRSAFERDVGFNDPFGSRVDEAHPAPRGVAGARGAHGRP
jgi:hypothetical protein